MFDEVSIRCPKCQHCTVVQSKAGRCILAYYKIEDAPLEIVADIASRENGMVCESCGQRLSIRTSLRVTVDEYDEWEEAER